MMKQNSVKEEISMNASFHTGNRKRLYEVMKPASLLVMFSGEDVRKTNDEYYPFIPTAISTT